MPYIAVPVIDGDLMNNNIPLQAFHDQRLWLNGGLIAADIVADTIGFRHFPRMEQFEFPTYSSFGQTREILGRSLTDNDGRVTVTQELLDSEDHWRVPDLARRVYIDKEVRLVVHASWRHQVLGSLTGTGGYCGFFSLYQRSPSGGITRCTGSKRKVRVVTSVNVNSDPYRDTSCQVGASRAITNNFGWYEFFVMYDRDGSTVFDGTSVLAVNPYRDIGIKVYRDYR